MAGSLAAVVVMEVLKVVMLKRRRKNFWLSWGRFAFWAVGLDVSVWPVFMEEAPPLLLCPSAGSGPGSAALLPRVLECTRPSCEILLSGYLYNEVYGSFILSKHGKPGERVCV